MSTRITLCEVTNAVARLRQAKEKSRRAPDDRALEALVLGNADYLRSMVEALIAQTLRE